MDNILEVKNVRKDFTDFSLRNISFNLKKGFIMGFIGPNGAGKTTTIKLIMNLMKRNEGEIKIFGLDNVAYEQEIKQKIGFVYDENHYFEELNAQDLRRVIGRVYHDWDDRIFQDYIERFKLPLRKPLKSFSKGMKMKFSLAMALSHQPQLLIMDEPTSGLDPVFRSEVLEILREFMNDDKGILFSSHLTSDLDKIADYVCLINDGQIIINCSREELLEKYLLVKGEKKQLSEELRQAMIGVRLNDFGFSGLACDAEKIQSGWKDRLIFERPTLEDIMLYMVRRETNA